MIHNFFVFLYLVQLFEAVTEQRGIRALHVQLGTTLAHVSSSKNVILVAKTLGSLITIAFNALTEAQLSKFSTVLDVHKQS